MSTRKRLCSHCNGEGFVPVPTVGAIPTLAAVREAFAHVEAQRILSLVETFRHAVIHQLNAEPWPEDGGVRKEVIPEDVPDGALAEIVDDMKAAGWAVRVVDVPELRRGGYSPAAAHKVLEITPGDEQ